MASFSDQLQEVKTLLLPPSSSRGTKPLAYSTLLHLQERSSSDSSSIQMLSQASPDLLPPILDDISDYDEEIAAPALKCLGFMIYHPVLVAVIPDCGATAVLSSLAEVITSTKVKSVCNLGTWCISVQQFKESFLATNFHSLLKAVVHALDNPIGSLSTTFEAIQAIMKLSNQINGKMKETSHIWAPPIYRRLISIDKKERDMSERCLSKIKSTVLPPLPSLSKAIVLDIKQILLPGMRELLNHGMKVQALQAWGWFLHLLGSYSLKNSQMVNDLLKIPEQTFSDHDSQVQIASQVAWEALIDALFVSPVQGCDANAALKNGMQQSATFGRISIETHIDKLLKITKLVMTPLVGIVSSRCDPSVHLSCLSTWCYLLYKLDAFVNNPSVMKIVVEPIFEVVFGMGPISKRIWIWDVCLELLDDSILASYKDIDSNNQGIHHVSMRTTAFGPPLSGCSMKRYLIKWLPWDLTRLDFYFKMVHILIIQGSMAKFSPENRSAACDAALKILRSVVRGVKMKFENPSTNYDEIMLCFEKILSFVRGICEDKTLEGNGILHTSLQFVETVAEELVPAMLGSPLYKVALDLDYLDDSQLIMEVRCAEILGDSTVAHMDMVSPIIYLITLYFFTLAKSLNTMEEDVIVRGLHRFLVGLFSSHNSLETLHAFVALLYRNMEYSSMKIWMVVAKAVKAFLDDVKDLTELKKKSHCIIYVCIRNLLFYPFAVFSCLQKQQKSAKTEVLCRMQPPSSLNNLEVGHVSQVWKFLYQSVSRDLHCFSSTTNSFSEDLCSLLNGSIDDKTIMVESDSDSSNKKQDSDVLLLLADAVIYVLDQIPIMKANLVEKQTNSDSDNSRSLGIKSRLGFAARFMNLFSQNKKVDSSSTFSVITRILVSLVRIVGCLQSKHDIISFIEVLSDPLLPWLSQAEKHDQSTFSQLELLWTGTLNCLRRSSPPIDFDSSFLKLQASLLERTLDHPNSSISEPTISFWNSTYGEQINLDFPRNMLYVLDKLSRSGKLHLCKRSPAFLQKCHSRLEVPTAPHRYSVAAANTGVSKRVELVEVTRHGSEPKGAGFKRTRQELTEHQKEVRRAQQGRERDCSGHGPGIRTYTSLDFSQGNEDLQESQEIRDSESILEMLRRAA